MTTFTQSQVSLIVLSILATLLVLAAYVCYVQRSNHPTLYYYGAAPEVPDGTAIPVLNPFRSRKDEVNAEKLIQDLRTEKCEQIAAYRLRTDPKKICSVLRGSTKASLIWLEPESDRKTRTLVYDVPEGKARLVVRFGNSDMGWGVDTAFVVR
jgi:hypothetical protein